MRHSWVKTASPRSRKCVRCGTVERERVGPGGSWRKQYAKEHGDKWNFAVPACSGDPDVTASRPKRETGARCEVVVQERPYLLCAEDVARLLALPGRDAVLAEVESGRLEKPVAGERWPPSDLLTYASALQALRDQGEVDADRR